jgi:hypothetical protein
MNKFSSGAASWITKSLLGDDERESNAGAGREDTSGPFGKVNGESPTISRNESTTELYNPMAAMNSGYQAISNAPPSQYRPASGGGGRYAPNGGASRYAPSMASSVSSIPDASRPQTQRSHTAGPSMHDTFRSDTGSAYSPSDSGRPYSSDSRQADLHDQPYGSYGQHYQMHQQPVAEEDEPQDAFSQPSGLGLHNGSGTDEVENFASTSSGYEPPTSGYEPPSYQPYEPEPDQPSDDEAAPKPKKKSFMDDDDDDGFAQRAAQMKKAQADREADEAFKKAAEADAARDKSKGSDKRNSGWLSGWFKKEGAEGQQQQGPIRAKLGEENSFYYDENLKKWVNKKAGTDAATPTPATAPPPRAGPPSRPASTVTGPPSRVASGSLPMRPPTSNSMYGSTPPIGGAGGLPSGPPSRVGTPGGGVPIPLPAAVSALNPGTPPSRPSTTMSADSLDDILGGPPGPRKGGAAGAAKNKKKGRGYIDVMAK